MNAPTGKQKKHVVIGSAGQLGRDLCSRLPGEVIPLTRADFDLTDPRAPRAVLERLQPGVVINAAAYNFVDRAESDPGLAFEVNAWAVKRLAVICRDLGSTLVHFSTDYVYGVDADRREPYRETDPAGPLSVYGLSKLSGEFLVRASCPRYFVIRTCGLYGAWGSGGKGGNFVETMLRLAREGKPLRVVHDQVCTPSHSADIAEAIVQLIQTDQYGLYHLTNAGCCSWYQFAEKIFEIAGLKANLTAVSSAEYGAAAQRPKYSVLSNSAYENLGLSGLRPWGEALAAYLATRAKA